MNDLLDRLRKRITPANPFWYQTFAVGANHPQAHPQTVQSGTVTIGGPDVDVQDAITRIETLERDAEELANALRDVLAGHPVRNADELIARYSPLARA